MAKKPKTEPEPRALRRAPKTYIVESEGSEAEFNPEEATDVSDGEMGADDSIVEVEPPVRTPKSRAAAARPAATPPPTKEPKRSRTAAARPAATPPPSVLSSAPLPAPSAVTADEILATIPDADLPELDPDEAKKGFNFFKKTAAATQSPSEAPEIPEAQPNCLAGLTIVFTGVLPTLDRDALENLAKKYGAKVTKSISGKTSLVVIGDDAGPSKVAKIQKLAIKAINEAGFIELLTRMPAEGGDGEAAAKARAKREEDERAVAAAAAAEAAEAAAAEQRDAERRAAQRAAAQQNLPSSQPAIPARETTDAERLWTVKYAPRDLSQLCGNKGQIAKLRSWLSNWFANAKHDFKNPGKDGTGIYRACLISGPPGIGKTLAAHLIARSLGFDVLEKNASDVRSKLLLNATIRLVLSNTSVVGFFKHRGDAQARKFCLIMDEVDGMLSGDHGGAGALLQFCRVTQMPIILICNDKSLPKMRTFDRITLDLAFRRPLEAEVKARLMTIALREGVKLDPTVIGQLVAATNNDIRQMINLMATISRTQRTIGHPEAKDVAALWRKETILKPFDIVGKLLNAQIYNAAAKHLLNDKINLYFNDIDLTPLMVQENYLYTRPAHAQTAQQHLAAVAAAADAILQLDHVNSLIRSSEQQWSLLPFHAVMLLVLPALLVAGTVTARINFAGWLGQNLRAMKYERLLQELQYHTRLRTGSDKRLLRLDYVPLLAARVTAPLADDDVDRVIAIMDHYYLTREDWDLLVELGVGPASADAVLKRIATKTKTAFTRKYNARLHPTAIYKTGNSVTGRGTKQKVDYDDVVEDDTKDDAPDAPDAPDAIDKRDKLIKEVKPRAKPKPKRAKK